MAQMNRWFYFNFGLLCLTLWNLGRKNFFIHWQTPLLLGMISLLFILFNWTRHAMYSTIREAKDRQRKIKYARLSKKAVHIHKWTGTTALILALFHGFFVWQTYKFTLFQIKMIFGLLAILTLFSVVIAGWLRHFRPTLRKRYWHLYLAMTMIFLVLIHILL